MSMKKIITLFFVVFIVANLAYAGGDWATSAVSLTKDGGSATNYVLNNQGWTDGTWGANTAFDVYDFGTPVSLVLNGGSGNAWTDDLPGYDGTSFVLYYRVYRNGDTPGVWSSVALDYQAYHSGNNYIYDKSNATVDVLALATLAGTNTYTLEVVMSKNQYYTGGNWNSMVPGGQAVAYSAINTGYKATFTKNLATDVKQIDSNLKISTQSGKIAARFDGTAKVELYSVTGQLIRSASFANEFTQSVKSGAYLLLINGQTHKVLVQ
jgi:hypothetical protein